MGARWEHRGEERRLHLLKEVEVSRKVVIRKRAHDVVIHAPKWTTHGGPKRKTAGLKTYVTHGPKNGDAAVVISHDDIAALCEKLQEILAKEGRR